MEAGAQVVRDGMVRGCHAVDGGVEVGGATSLRRWCWNLAEVVVGVEVGIEVGGVGKIHGCRRDPLCVRRRRG